MSTPNQQAGNQQAEKQKVENDPPTVAEETLPATISLEETSPAQTVCESHRQPRPITDWSQTKSARLGGVLSDGGFDVDTLVQEGIIEAEDLSELPPPFTPAHRAALSSPKALPGMASAVVRHDQGFSDHAPPPWHQPSSGLELSPQVLASLPSVVMRAGPQASKRFVEFFLVTIHNPNTRAAYERAVNRFLEWCDSRGLALEQIEPLVVAAYIQSLRTSPQTVKQHLAAIRMLFDHLVTGQVLPFNPAASVKGPKYVIKKGKTPVLTAKEARALLDSIDCSTLIGLRDRALIGLMTYTFARVSAAIGTNVGDYYGTGRRTWIRLHEKGGKYHEVPLHHNADEYLHIYIEAAGIGDERKGPLFRTCRGRSKTLSQNRMHRVEVAAMIKRRARAAGLATDVCCHTFRATGITAYLENGGTIEKAQQIAAHESPRTTKLYDRTDDTLTLDEVERILI